MSKFGLSQIPIHPTFRDSSVNNVAVVPLLSRDSSNSSTKSSQSFEELFESLRRHSYTSENSQKDLLLVVPNSSLTRPGDWRYSDTPLKSFHWQHGCQRLLFHDGRPQQSRRAHDRLLMNRDWVDICPHRRTAAVVGVLNMHDCCVDGHEGALQEAIEELHQWAQRYATPPYQVTAQGGSFARDAPVERLFVYDSFDVDSRNNDQLDLSQGKLGTSILAFPPSDAAHKQMMDLHMNVVISDLTVAIFRDLENKVQESSEFGFSHKGESTPTMRSALSRYISGGSAESSNIEEEPVRSSRNLGVNQLAGLVSPDSKLAKDSSTASRSNSSRQVVSATIPETSPLSIANRSLVAALPGKPSRLPQLMTPMDGESGNLPSASASSSKDADAWRRRDQSRREKYTADLCLLAGSPLDAYERYLKTAEVCKTTTPDPLWLAAALVGCAAAHIAMAEAGGYSVDEYLENNFQLPEDIMSKAREDNNKRQSSVNSANKQTLPEVVFELCENALDILNRSNKLAHLNAELLLKLASYCCEESEAHLRCRWGEGPGCYAGETNDLPRWEKTSISKLTFNPLKTETGDMIAFNTYVRTVKMCDILGRAVTIGPLDAPSRVDVAIRCSQLCLRGLKPTFWIGRKEERVRLSRKAAYFAVCGAEAAAMDSNRDAQQQTIDLWVLATKLYSFIKNSSIDHGQYGWATLRAICYDALAVLDNSRLAIEANEQLLSILGDLDPSEEEAVVPTLRLERKKKSMDATDNVSVSESPSEEFVVPKDAESQNALAQARFFASNFISSSPYLAQQSKWASEGPVPSIPIPLHDSPLTTSLIALRSSWPTMEYATCCAAQQKCIDRLSALQKVVPTRSHVATDEPSIFGFPKKSLPVFVSSPVDFLDAEEFECVRKRSTDKKDQQGTMATFYNPFESKKASTAPTARVSEGEERAVTIRFGNRLSLPIDIREARVEFLGGKARVKTPALSFAIPPCAIDFAVNFPFTVCSPDDSDTSERGTVFEVEGIKLSCLGRNFYIPIESAKTVVEQQMSDEAPKFETPYRFRLKLKAKAKETDVLTPRVEAYPCQPLLQVSFSATGSAAKSLVLDLSDGEVLTIPEFQLARSRDSIFNGSIEHLEVLLTGSMTCKLYDSAAGTPSKVVESEMAFSQDLLCSENPVPFKVRVISQELDLVTINNSKREGAEGCKFAIQIATAHNFGRQFHMGSELFLCFRYRGLCNSDTEIWRKTVVRLDLSYMKGPRLSAIALRPDIASDSLLASIATNRDVKDEEETVHNVKIDRIGMDSLSSHCDTHCMVVLTVANETRSVLTVSRPDREQFGFPAFPVTTTKVLPGVSAKITINFPRIARFGPDEEPTDVLSAFVNMTSLVWEMQKSNVTGPMKASGRIRIPPSCLADIVSRHPSFVAQISKPPCSVSLLVNGGAVDGSSISVIAGTAIDVSASVAVHEWLPQGLAQECSLSIEFNCVRYDGSAEDGYDFAWAGKQRRTFELCSTAKTHSMKLIFCKEGEYIVSTCAVICRKEGQAKECWWSPCAQRVVVAGPIRQ